MDNLGLFKTGPVRVASSVGVENVSASSSPGGSPAPPPTSGGEKTRTIASGSQSKNITVNLGSLVENYSPTSQVLNNMPVDQVESYLTEMLLRVIRGVEMGQL